MPASPKPSWSTSPPVYSCAHLTCPILMLHIAQFRCKQLCKGDSISHPLWYACFPQAFMVIFSTGLFLCLPHSSLSLSCAPCPVTCIISWPHPVCLGPIMHRRYKHYLYCTVSLIWLFYHFKINLWGDKVYYTELCTGIQWFILMYSTGFPMYITLTKSKEHCWYQMWCALGPGVIHIMNFRVVSVQFTWGPGAYHIGSHHVHHIRSLCENFLQWKLQGCAASVHRIWGQGKSLWSSPRPSHPQPTMITIQLLTIMITTNEWFLLHLLQCRDFQKCLLSNLSR